MEPKTQAIVTGFLLHVYVLMCGGLYSVSSYLWQDGQYTGESSWWVRWPGEVEKQVKIIQKMCWKGRRSWPENGMTELRTPEKEQF